MTAIYLFSLDGWAGGGINMLPPNQSDESSLSDLPVLPSGSNREKDFSKNFQERREDHGNGGLFIPRGLGSTQ